MREASWGRKEQSTICLFLASSYRQVYISGGQREIEKLYPPIGRREKREKRVEKRKSKVVRRSAEGRETCYSKLRVVGTAAHGMGKRDRSWEEVLEGVKERDNGNKKK